MTEEIEIEFPAQAALQNLEDLLEEIRDLRARLERPGDPGDWETPLVESTDVGTDPEPTPPVEAVPAPPAPVSESEARMLENEKILEKVMLETEADALTRRLFGNA